MAESPLTSGLRKTKDTRKIRFGKGNEGDNGHAHTYFRKERMQLSKGAADQVVIMVCDYTLLLYTLLVG